MAYQIIRLIKMEQLKSYFNTTWSIRLWYVMVLTLRQVIFLNNYFIEIKVYPLYLHPKDMMYG